MMCKLRVIVNMCVHVPIRAIQFYDKRCVFSTADTTEQFHYHRIPHAVRVLRELFAFYR